MIRPTRPAHVPQFSSPDEERTHIKQRMAAAFRLFDRFGFNEGVAGHLTARDPERPDCFWVNPFGLSFGLIRASDLILVNHQGEVVEGDWPVNVAAFAIHSQVHAARPDVQAAAHTHSKAGRAWSTLGRLLDPLTQDACAFYEDHGLFDDYTGVVIDTEEGKRIAHALGDTQGRHPAQPRHPHRRPHRRRGGLAVHHDGAHLRGPARWPRRPATPVPIDAEMARLTATRSAATSPAGSASSPSTTRSSPTSPTSSTESRHAASTQAARPAGGDAATRSSTPRTATTSRPRLACFATPATSWSATSGSTTAPTRCGATTPPPSGRSPTSPSSSSPPTTPTTRSWWRSG